MFSKVKIVLFIVLSGIAMQAFCASDCTVHQSIIQTVSLGTVNVQRDKPLNSEIGRVVIPGSASISAYSDTGSQYCDARLYMNYLSGAPSTMAGVYRTNLDGVGIQVSGMPAAWYATSSGAGFRGFVNPSNYTVILYKTGKITPGKLTAGQVGYGWWGSAGNNFINISLDSNTEIKVQSCSLSSTALSFDLGTLSASEFGSTVGYNPGRTATQSLGLNCDPDANVNIELKGVQNPDAMTNDSVLALSGQGSQNVADGVGVQFLYNNNVLRINNRLMLKKSAGGQESFPIIARYYQTKPVVKAGDANAAATLDITYQ